MEIIQKQILHKAIQSPLFSKDVLPKTPLSVFEGNEIYKELSAVIKKYYQTKSDMLTEDRLLTLAEEKLDRLRKTAEEQQPYYNAVNELYQIRDFADDSVIDEKIEGYIKKHMRMDLLKRAATRLDDEKFMESVDREFKEIMLLDISGRKQEIINVIDDTEYKRRALSTIYQNTIPTGLTAIDRLNGGGLAKGELGLVVAQSGTGKSMTLINLAANYTKRKQNVLFIALEELENRMILKFEQSLLRQNKSDILSGQSLNDTKFDELQGFYKKHREHLGNLFFARYSPRSVTPAKVEQLISDVMVRKGVVIDVVIIDYPELLRNPNSTGNESEDGGKLFEEMRRIGQDYNVVMWTAAQMNRTAYSADIKTAEHMEGSHRKKNAAELVLTINQTQEEFNNGFIRYYADKLRNPPEGGFDRMVGFKVIGSAMTIKDYDNDREEHLHKSLLEEVDNRKMGDRSKYKSGKQKPPEVNYSDQINGFLTNEKQEAQ